MSEDKEWTRQEIWQNIQEYDKWLERAIVALYKLQTADEKRTHRTQWKNNVGFSATDDDFLTSLAEGIQEYGSLTDNQKDAARPLLEKYCSQLADIANDNLDERRQ